MLPPRRMASPGQRQLLELYDGLDAAGRKQLLDFAGFLHGRNPATPEAAPEKAPASPRRVPRPAQESVVAAMRRLSDSYFMLEKDSLLHEASDLMSAHVLQGRSADLVIDDLEALFEQAYRRTTGRDVAE